jgi:hypothetical protein
MAICSRQIGDRTRYPHCHDRNVAWSMTGACAHRAS